MERVRKLFNRVVTKLGRADLCSWGYDEFRSYALALTTGSEALLPSNQYPNRFQLSEGWRETFIQMRNEGRNDRLENLALIGYRGGENRSLYLTKILVKGGEKSISGDIVWEEFSKVRNRTGIDTIGDFHYHPRERKIGRAHV